MKKLILTFVFAVMFSCFAFGQGQSQSYYDAEKTKLKEVFMLKTVTTINPMDPASSKEKSVKNGPYFYYYENGKLQTSGQYSDDKKTGEWKYYDLNGKLERTEKYENGKLVQ